MYRYYSICPVCCQIAVIPGLPLNCCRFVMRLRRIFWGDIANRQNEAGAFHTTQKAPERRLRGFPTVPALPLLNIKTLHFHLYGKIFINSNWYILSKIVLLKCVILKPIDHYPLFFRINNPIFSDACRAVLKQFYHIIPLLTAR